MFTVTIHYKCVNIPHVINTTVVCVESPRTGKFVVVEYAYIPEEIKKTIRKTCKIPDDCNACRALTLGRELCVLMDLTDLKNIHTKRIYSRSVLYDLGLNAHPHLIVY